MSDRGMKKWAPYASLIEQKSTIQKMRMKRSLVKKPHLSQEAAETLDEAIRQSVGKHCRVKFFHEGVIYEELFFFRKIDFDQRLLIFSEVSLPINDILAIHIEK